MQKLIIANWKMNGTLKDADVFLREFLKNKNLSSTYVICPPFTLLNYFQERSDSLFHLGAQNCSSFDNGAYTGEISASMLKEIGCHFCLIGHSERRQLFDENKNDLLLLKVKKLIENDITPIYCIGENLEERKKGLYLKTIQNQLIFLQNFKENIIIAYEPMWSVGTNLLPQTREINEVHDFIKTIMREDTKVIYGGSVNPKNASELLQIASVDGVLVGRAGLEASSLIEIGESLYRAPH